MDKNSFEKLKQFVKTNCLDVYFGLRKNLYTITYSKFEDSSITKFNAYLKSSQYVTNLPKILQVDFPCKIEDVLTNTTAPLVLFLYADKNLFQIDDNEDLDNSKNNALTAELINKFSNIDFDKYLENRIENKYSLSISIFIKPTYLSINFKLNFNGTLYTIQNIDSFCDKYFNHGVYSFGSKKIKIAPEYFSSDDNMIILTLSTLSAYRDFIQFDFDENTPKQSIKEAGTIFHYLRNADIKIFNGEVVTDYIQINDGYFHVNNDYSLDIFPDTESIKFFVQHDNELFIVKDNELSLYLFPSKNACSMYIFILENGIDSFNSIKSKFFSDVFVVSPSDYMSLDFDNKYEICLYVDIINKQTLNLDTKYYLNFKEITKREVEHDLYFKALNEAYTKLLEGFKLSPKISVNDADIFEDFIQADLSELKKYATIYLSESIKRLSIAKTGSFATAHFSKHNDFLSLTIDSDNYSNDELAAVYNAYRQRKEYVILNDKFISLKNSEVEEFTKLMDQYKIKGNNLYLEGIPFYDLYKYNLDKERSIEIDDMCFDALTNVKNYESIELPEKIEKFKSIARDYQITAVKWLTTLSNNHLSGILADDMGLGKTFETLMYLYLLEDNLPILIVTPKSLTYNWGEEIKKFIPDIDYHIVEGTKETRNLIISKVEQNKKVIYISSYDSLRNDIDMHENILYSAIILDEGQYIKNAYAKKSVAVRKLKSNHRFVLTGTPIENSLADLWSIFDFLMPNFLGTYRDFRYRFETTDEDEATKYNEELAFKIKPFVLRRLKEDVLKSLPPKTETIVKVPMELEQRKLYLAYLSKAREKINSYDDLSGNKIHIFQILTRLRELCVDPCSFIEQFPSVSSKLSLAIDTTKEITQNNRKVVIFSSFVKVLDHLKTLLKDNENIDSYFIHGQVDAQKRIEMCNNFNTKDDIKVMLVSIKAGGTGLNLIGADTVIHLDLWWNIQVEKQATDRTHRIGQTKSVNVYKYVSYDSIEERILEIQQYKSQLFEDVIKSSDNLLSSLTDEDIKKIFS